jgi:hypothetical protein
VLVSIPACGIALANELRMSVGSLVASLRGWAIRFAAAAVICLMGARFLDVHGFLGVAMIGLGVAVVYGALMWPLALEAPLGPYVRAGTASAAAFFGVRRETIPESRV